MAKGGDMTCVHDMVAVVHGVHEDEAARGVDTGTWPVLLVVPHR